MKINLNQQATIILTKYGAEKLNNYNKDLYEVYSIDILKEYKAGDTYKDQLWELFNIFNNFYCGANPYFLNNEIELL
jgi:hypothetical protein